MLLGNKEKTIRLHAENFLQGNLTFDYGVDEEEKEQKSERFWLNIDFDSLTLKEFT